MDSPREQMGGTESTFPPLGTSAKSDSFKTPDLPLPHKSSMVIEGDSAWNSRLEAQSPSRDLVSPEWAVAGPQRRLARRRSRAPKESPVGIPPLRLEDRFNALEANSEPEARLEVENEASSPVVGNGSENAFNEVAINGGEFSGGVAANSAPWRIGDRPVDGSWPPGSLVKWKDPKHPGFFEYDFGIVSTMSCEEEEVQRDDRPWREGKVTVYTGESHVWVSTDELILFPPGSSIPRELSHGAASPSPHSDTHSDAPLDPWDWMSGRGLLDAGSLELHVPQSCLPHLIGKKGSFIRVLENKLGVIIGVMDGPRELATVSLVGPIERLELAGRVVEIVSKGARSFLDHLQWPPSPG